MGKNDYGPPPTIGDLRARGVTGFDATCRALTCRHTGAVTFDQAGMPDEMVFLDLRRSRRFRCIVCGRRRIEVSPDWRGAQLGAGMGDTWGRMPPA